MPTLEYSVVNVEEIEVKDEETILSQVREKLKTPEWCNLVSKLFHMLCNSKQSQWSEVAIAGTVGNSKFSDNDIGFA